MPLFEWLACDGGWGIGVGTGDEKGD
jgi:hypothetical protein